VQFTVVVPAGNVVPDAGVQLTVGVVSTRSIAVAVKLTTAPLALVAFTVMFAGTVSWGGVVSPTVTVKVLVATLPAASAAEQVTAFAPRWNVLPDPGAQLTLTEPLTASLAVGGVKVKTAPAGLVASMVALAGVPLSTGGAVSLTVTSKLFDAALPWASVAVHVTACVPRANVDPLAGLQLTATAPSTTSAAVGAV
jgi:hypothetical protein